jgi:hypothetical protein
VKKIRKMQRDDMRQLEAEAEATAVAAGTMGVPNPHPGPDPNTVVAPFRRNWSNHPIFLCSPDCVLWFEACNSVSHEPPPISSAAGVGVSPCHLRPIQDHLTWNDVHVWNSSSCYEMLRPPAHPKITCPT